MQTVFAKRPLNKIEFACGDVMISAIYGFLDGTVTSGEYHDHISFEMHLIGSGCGEMVTEQERIPFEADTLLLIPPHTLHCPVPGTVSVFEDLTVMFACQRLTEGEGNEEKSLYHRFESLMSDPGTIVHLHNPLYGDSVKQIREAMEETEAILGKAIVRNLLEKVFLYLLKDMGALKRTGEEGAARKIPEAPASGAVLKEPQAGRKARYPDFLIVKRIDEYIQRLSADVTLDGLAEYINMSRRSTQRLVAELYGQSFSKKQAEFRLHAAAELMKREEKTLAQIAEEVGYEEYTTFHKAFLKRFGMQPSEYRKRLKRKEEE